VLVNDPIAVPEAEKLTVPDGIMGEPRFVVLSVTVEVHVEGRFTITGLLQETVVVVTRSVILIVAVEVAALVL